MLHRIENITNIDQYFITCIWNDVQKRIIDFKKFMADYPQSLKFKFFNNVVKLDRYCFTKIS